MNKKIEIRTYGKNFQAILTNSSNDIVIKFNPNKIDNIAEIVKSYFSINICESPGVYLIDSSDGIYIGETKDLEKRFKEHNASNEMGIKTITFATASSVLYKMNKEEIKDIESILIDIASESFELKNIKKEKRKTLNNLTRENNTDRSEFIWESFQYLNILSLLNSYKLNLRSEANILEKKTHEKNKNKNWISVNSIESLKSPVTEIYNYINFENEPSSGYLKYKIDVFSKNVVNAALLNYLYDGIGGGRNDNIITKGKRNKGWLTSATLAFLRMPSNGSARGVLRKSGLSRIESEKLINEIIQLVYK